MSVHSAPAVGTPMRAVVRTSADTTDVAFAQMHVPVTGSDELLVRVETIGVGIHDPIFLPSAVRYPHTIGIEAAGRVVAVGQQVDRFGPSDRIAFVSSMQASGGTWAEYAVARKDSLIASVPDGLDTSTAAGLPVAGNTALRALRPLPAPVGDRPTLFVSGGSGAIGTIAIQLARRAGWTVAASASAANHEYMSSLGAELTVDYRDPDWRRQVLNWTPHGVQAAIAIQPGTTAEALPVVADSGVVVTVSGDSPVAERGITVRGLDYASDVGAQVQSLFDEAAAGSLHVEIEHDYSFDEALEALEKVRTRRARGKVVISMD